MLPARAGFGTRDVTDAAIRFLKITTHRDA